MSIIIWGIEGGQWKLRTILQPSHRRTIRRLAFSPLGNYLAASSFDGTCSIWEIKHGEFKVFATLEGHENEVKAVAWDASGSLLATCSRDKTVWIWEMDEDTKDFECVSVLNGHTQDVKSVKFHPGKEMLASCSYDDTIKLWADVQNDDEWSCVTTLSAHASTVWEISFNKSGTHLVSASDDKSTIIWKNTSGNEWQPVNKFTDHTRSVYSVNWSPLNFIASCGRDDAICVYTPSGDTFTLAAKKNNAHSTDINCVAWHPSEPILASAGDDGLVKLWKFK
eukprot:TRINITY_DN13730_c0_g1_i1.p1 TRINITY_DN13730_c0_g1~~TRINITY_DN13730_c0_g1_i1.p1  ORF type:complete len:320 (-),score=62.08 TRINITY_DN13730_c0_g1_i1:41-880(-)